MLLNMLKRYTFLKDTSLKNEKASEKIQTNQELNYKDNISQSNIYQLNGNQNKIYTGGENQYNPYKEDENRISSEKISEKDSVLDSNESISENIAIDISEFNPLISLKKGIKKRIKIRDISMLLGKQQKTITETVNKLDLSTTNFSTIKDMADIMHLDITDLYKEVIFIVCRLIVIKGKKTGTCRVLGFPYHPYESEKYYVEFPYRVNIIGILENINDAVNLIKEMAEVDKYIISLSDEDKKIFFKEIEDSYLDEYMDIPYHINYIKEDYLYINRQIEACKNFYKEEYEIESLSYKIFYNELDYVQDDISYDNIIKFEVMSLSRRKMAVYNKNIFKDINESYSPLYGSGNDIKKKLLLITGNKIYKREFKCFKEVYKMYIYQSLKEIQNLYNNTFFYKTSIYNDYMLNDAFTLLLKFGLKKDDIKISKKELKNPEQYLEYFKSDFRKYFFAFNPYFSKSEEQDINSCDTSITYKKNVSLPFAKFSFDYNYEKTYLYIENRICGSSFSLYNLMLSRKKTIDENTLFLIGEEYSDLYNAFKSGEYYNLKEVEDLEQFKKYYDMNGKLNRMYIEWNKNINNDSDIFPNNLESWNYYNYFSVPVKGKYNFEEQLEYIFQNDKKKNINSRYL